MAEAAVRPIDLEREGAMQVTDIIQLSVSPKASIRDLIVFPRPDFLIGPPALEHIKSVALLRLRDETVWMLVLQGQAWTNERVHLAAGVLSGASQQAFTTSSVARLLREELGFRSLSVTIPPIDRIDERLWEIDKVAFALVRQPAAGQLYRGIDQARPEDSEWTVRSNLRDGLREALRRFVDALNPQALRIATAGRHFDLRIYNYLVHTEYRQYRQQFAETFPSLLQTAVVAGPAGFGEDLRSIVDAGEPLVKGLAARWDVRPGVIRHLVGRASGNVGFQWTRDAKGLAVALNALHPQDVPGDNPAEWDEFNRAVVTGQRLFLRPIWKSVAGLEWLRMCIRLSRRGDKEALAAWLPDWNDVDQIVQFRAALAQAVQREIPDSPSDRANNSGTSVADAVDNVVLDFADQGLLDAAKAFSEELSRERQKDRVQQILAREILMPLVPEDFVSADGTTRVTALCTNHQLYRHGKTIRNCLRSTSVASIARSIQPGTEFIIGLYDVASGKALSTAEIRAFPGRNYKTYHLVTRQHTGKANSKPTPQCTRTLREFLDHCQSDEVREHLLMNWKALRGPGISETGRQANLPVALRSTLGEQAYAGLVTSIRETNREP